jgi:hypothetical protein
LLAMYAPRLAPLGISPNSVQMHKKNDMEDATMIIDVQRHLVAKDTVQGDLILGEAERKVLKL